MAYIPTEWNTGDIVTAEKLNKMEDGIENANDNVLIIELTNVNPSELESTSPILPYSFNDLKSAILNGAKIYISVVSYDSSIDKDVQYIELFYDIKIIEVIDTDSSSDDQNFMISLSSSYLSFNYTGTDKNAPLGQEKPK